MTHQNSIGTLLDQYTCSYDPVGNRLTGPQGSDSHSYNAGNQLTTGPDYSYVYDQNGSLTSKSSAEGTIFYGYDDENRLRSVYTSDANHFLLIDYHYDPFGRRIDQWIEEYNAATGDFVSTAYAYTYDNEDIVAVKKTVYQSGVTTTENINTLHGPGIDEPLMATHSQGTYYYHADGLGSIVALTDATEQIAERYSYSAFGEIKRLNGVDNPYTFTGREYDEETGLYYYRARYYDAEAGRFLSEDPIGIEGGINLYSYVESNPINRTDPHGLKPGDKYQTQDEAAIAALNDIINISISQDLEYSGWIYKNLDGCTYSYTFPNQGTAHSSSPGVKPPNATAAYHTHGAESGPLWDDEHFSPSDRGFGDGLKVDVYLMTPSRKQLKYSPC